MTGLLLLLRWQFLRYRQLLVLFIGIQVALGVGIVFGFAFLIPHITSDVALYLTTGAPTLSLILLGLSAVPQEVAQARVSGQHMYVMSLPVPRLAPMFADVCFWVVMFLPGSAATFALGILRFHIHLQVSPLVIPAVALVSLTSAAVGYSIAVSLPPMATQQVTQFVSIALLLFSPVDFPLSRLPVALQDVHRALPVTYMADIVRGSLTGSYSVSRALAFGVVGAWCAAGLAISVRAANRRA